MIEWFNALGLTGQIFLCIALPASVILLIQIVMSLIGLGHDADADADTSLPDDQSADGVFGDDVPDNAPDVSAADTADLQFFSFRSVIAFLTTFGWMGVSLCNTGLYTAVVTVIAFACGVVVMLAVALMMRAIYRLQSNGTADIRDALGVSATVYMTVPAARAGKGKVNLLLADSYVEREAVTDETEPMPYGTEVVVVGIVGGNTLLVARKK